MKSSNFSQKFFLVFIMTALLFACSPPPSDVQVIETNSNQIVVPEIIHINNCGGKADTQQTSTRSFTTKIDGNVTAGLPPEVIQGSISAQYGEVKNNTKSITLVAPPGTNMEFTLEWTEQTFTGRVVAYGETGSYTAKAPISVNQVSAIDLICPGGSTETTTTSPTPLSGEITFWHAYGTGSAEEIALRQILNQAEVDLPNLKVNVLQVPFGDIYNKYRTEVASGGGPDIFIAPNDNLGEDARAGMLANISQLAAGKLNNYSQLSIDGMTVNGKLYGIPESQKAVVFWYNKAMLSNPPATTDELRAQMESGIPIGISFGCYHHFGFFGAFGGKVFDNNWNFVADQGNGVTNAMNYLNDLYQISKSNGWPTTDSDSLAPFSEGTVAGVTNGNWAMGDYRNALGDRLGVAPLPAGPGGPANPMLGIDGIYFNPNSTNKEAAIEFALYLTNQQSQTIMMNEAGHVPVNTSVNVTDPLITGLIAAFKNGYIRPQDTQLGKYWTNFCGTDQVFEAGVSAESWVREANANANK